MAGIGGPAAEIGAEKRRIAALARIREVIFGMQDGLISTVILVSSVYGATSSTFTTIVAGLAGALGGMVSMSAGSFLSSRAQREFHEAEIQQEAQQIEENPKEELAEMVEIYREEGFSEDDAILMAEKTAQDKTILLRTMVEKELGLSPDLPGSPWKDAVTMGVSFLIGATFPVAPYFFFTGLIAVAASMGLTSVGLFVMGVGKTRLTRRNPLVSGLEILIVGVIVGLLGYALGVVVPGFFNAETTP